ncbi:MAG TPA: PadR family transcriptional regulator [Solirubrobacteraceae bacterium]|jgi:DNA-binding PadR family transcriptional regulator|nr:PadR family transcriptional regulator [Solirubrobacteraceae bacterium]
MGRARSTEKAVVRVASVQEARAAAGARDPESDGALAGDDERAGGPGTTDPLVGDLRRAGLLPLLVLHCLSGEASYGHQLMERIPRLTGGLLLVNPNTMYPLLRSLESRGLVRGEWEHPERRSRRFYRLTEAGADERDRMLVAVLPHLDRVSASVEEIRRALLGAMTPAPTSSTPATPAPTGSPRPSGGD